jgi:hypothetical protein
MVWLVGGWGEVVGVRSGALVGVAAGMGVGTFSAGACWVLLRNCCIYC